MKVNKIEVVVEWSDAAGAGEIVAPNFATAVALGMPVAESIDKHLTAQVFVNDKATGIVLNIPPAIELDVVAEIDLAASLADRLIAYVCPPVKEEPAED